MPIKKTKAMNDKYQSTMKAFYGAIQAHNSLIQKLLEVGLSLESIDVLFGLKKLDFDTEFHNANPDLNLRYSGGKGGGGGIDLPLLTPDQLEQLFAWITNTPVAENTRTFNAFLGHLQNRANFISANVEEKDREAKAEPIALGQIQPAQFNGAMANLISSIATTPGLLNVHLPIARTDRTQPAQYQYARLDTPIDQIFNDLGTYLLNEQEFRRFIKETNEQYNIGLTEFGGVKRLISRITDYYNNTPDAVEKLRFRKYLVNFINGQGSERNFINVDQIKRLVQNPENTEKNKQLLIAIVNIICHGDDSLRQRFITILASQKGKKPETRVTNTIGEMMNLDVLKKEAGEYEGSQPGYTGIGAPNLQSTKMELIIGMIKNYLQDIGYVFNNQSHAPSEYTKPESERIVDPEMQKLKSEILENSAGNVYDRIMNHIQDSGVVDQETVQTIIKIIIAFYSNLRGLTYNTAVADTAYDVIMQVYDEIKREIDNKTALPVSSSNDTSIITPVIDTVRNLWGSIYTFLSNPDNRKYLGNLALLVFTPTPERIRTTVDEILNEFRLSSSSQVPQSDIIQPITSTAPTTTTSTAPITTTTTTPTTTVPDTVPDIVDTGTTSLSSFPTPVDATSRQLINIDEMSEDQWQSLLKRYMPEHEMEEKELSKEANNEAVKIAEKVLSKKGQEKLARTTRVGQERYYKKIFTRQQEDEGKHDTQGIELQSLPQRIPTPEETKVLNDMLDDVLDRMSVDSEAMTAEQKDNILDDSYDPENLEDIDFSGGEALPRVKSTSRLDRLRRSMSSVRMPSIPASWPRHFRLTRQYMYTTIDGNTIMFRDYESALYRALQDGMRYSADNPNSFLDQGSRIRTRYGLYYRVATPRTPSSSDLPVGRGGRGSGGGGGGGPPDGGDISSYGENERFRGLTMKDWIKLLAFIGVMVSGSITIDDLIKSQQDIDRNGNLTPPTGGTSGNDSKTPDVPKVPTKPPSTGGGGGEPSEDFFPDKYSKINHSELWDSIGLGGVIDTYNTYVDEYNEARQNKSLTKADLKVLNNKINNYYGKFAAATNTPTLPELVKAKSIYDGLRKEYDSASEKGLSFSNIIMLYKNLRDAANHVDELTSKYLDIENGIFGTAKSKDDADVTIDDDDYANISAKMTTSLGGKSKLMKPAQSILSKGMIERISRKLNNQSNFTNEELNDFNSFGMVKDYNYPNGLGSIENNPLIRRNKEYEIQQYLKCNPNPKPYIVPSKNKLEQYADADGTKYFHEIQNTDGVYENPFYVAKNKKVTLSNPYDNVGDQFNKSILFNPPINPKVKNVATGSNMIRSGAYYGVNKDPCYQYGNIEYKYNEKLNKYPLTNIEPMEKPTRQYKIASKVVKKSRVPDSYSLK